MFVKNEQQKLGSGGTLLQPQHSGGRAGGSQSTRLVWSIEQVPGQQRLQRSPVSTKTKNKNEQQKPCPWRDHSVSNCITTYLSFVFHHNLFVILSTCLLICWLPVSLIGVMTSSIFSYMLTIYRVTDIGNSYHNTYQLEAWIDERHQTKSAMLSALVELTEYSSGWR